VIIADTTPRALYYSIPILVLVPRMILLAPLPFELRLWELGTHQPGFI